VNRPPAVAAIIPASGRSSRMGTAKALLDADGKSFLERVAAALGGGGCSPIFVVVEDLRSPVAATARTAGCIPLENPDPTEGPISSLRVALRALPPDIEGFVICPVDHPLVEAGTVSALLDAFRAHGAPVTVPVYEGQRGHPALFHRRMEGELLEPGLPEGARTVMQRHADAIREVEVDDEGIAVDIDTLPEYRRYFPASYRKRFHAR
jgi:molybdenum cofactor cytidylyltransferase